MSDLLATGARLGFALIGLGVAAASLLIAWPTLALLMREASQKPAVERRGEGGTRYPLAGVRQIRLVQAIAATLILLSCVPVLGPAILYFAWGYYRPCFFELSREGMSVVWRLGRAAWIPTNTITEVQLLDGGAFAKQYGWFAIAGCHFLGDFGRGLGKAAFDAYLSRRDGYVLVRRANGRPLLLTPVEPERFAHELAQACRRRATSAVVPIDDG